MTTQCDPKEMEARRIAEGHAEVARMEAAGDVASLARIARQVAPLVALAEVFGWDGVENSKHLAEFFRERLVRATVDRHARQGLEAREETVRQALTEAGVPAGVERAPGIKSYFADDRVRWLAALTWELTAEGSRYAVLVEQMAMAVQAGVERDAVDRGATREQLVDMGHEYSRAIQERDAATRQVAEVNTALDDLFAKVVEEMRARDRQMDALRAEAERVPDLVAEMAQRTRERDSEMEERWKGSEVKRQQEARAEQAEDRRDASAARVKRLTDALAMESHAVDTLYHSVRAGRQGASMEAVLGTVERVIASRTASAEPPIPRSAPLGPAPCSVCEKPATCWARRSGEPRPSDPACDECCEHDTGECERIGATTAATAQGDGKVREALGCIENALLAVGNGLVAAHLKASYAKEALAALRGLFPGGEPICPAIAGRAAPTLTSPAPAQGDATGSWLPSTCGVLHYYVGNLTPFDARAECGSPAVLAPGGPHQGVCERCRFETGTTPPVETGVRS